MISLVEYEEALAEAVARMWHESADGWPPGFNCLSKTVEYVADKHRDGAYIHTTLAVDGDRVVGYIRTRQYGGEPDAAYVAFINVVTDMHGRGIGKRLLLDTIDRVAEAGYDRVDLDTWPGNLKAVPLYKKTGFLWVPDRDVHMENYLPLLLRRPEVRGLLGGDHWYGHLVHENLDTAPDLHETGSGRRVYRYRLERGGDFIEAEVDLAGRCLSGWKDGDREFRLSRGPGKLVFGRPVEMRLEGDGLPSRLELESNEDLEAPDAVSVCDGCGSVEVVPRPLAMPYSRRERAPRVMADLPLDEPLKLGMGFDAADAVEIRTLACRLTDLQKAVRLHLKRRAPEGKATLRWRLEEGEWSSRELNLSDAVFSGVEVQLGDLSPGIHTMEVRIDCAGAQGPLRRVMVSRGPLDGAQAWSCPRGAVMETNTLRLELRPQGARGSLFRLGREGAAGMGGFRILAGPPMFGGDLSSQRYKLSAGPDGLNAVCEWASKPGLRFGVSYSLDPCGMVLGRGEIRNGSASPEEIFFSAQGWESMGWPGDVLVPVEGAMVRSEQIFQLFPDHGSDLPREISEMPFPVVGEYVEASGCGSLASYQGWESFQSGCPRTGNMFVERGGEVSSPPIRKLVAAGGPGSLLDAAAAAGWRIGPSSAYVGFPNVNCPPIMPAGTGVSLSNPLRARRQAMIEIEGAVVAEGDLGQNEALSVEVEAGRHEIGFAASGVQRSRSVLAVEEERVETARDGDDLLLRGAGLVASINPGARGHVHSISYAGREWAFASDPKPTAFAWFNPWFGGIVPWLSPGGMMGRVARLEELEVEVAEAEQEIWGFRVPSWEMVWTLDHEDWMSVRIRWRVGLLPGLPALLAGLRVEPISGNRGNANAMVCGFLAPGGDRSSCLSKQHTGRGIALRRDSTGAFLLGGRLASVTGAEGHRLWTVAGHSSMLFIEDYAQEGSFASALGLPDSADGPLTSSAVWLLEEEAGDTGLAQALLDYDRTRPPLGML